MDYGKLFEERKDRVLTAIAGKEPDRVPNTLQPGTYPLKKAGITMAESMVNHERTCQIMLDYYAAHPQYDTASIHNFMPAAKVLENLDNKMARWPGDPKGLDENNTYQFIEFPTLLEDEYDEFFDSPAGFWINKHLPRTLGLFEFFGKMDKMDFYDLILGGASGLFTSPEAIPVYKRLLAAAEEQQRFGSVVAEYSAKATISAKALGGLKPITDAQIADLVKAFNLIP